jgi:hypothetical protein
LPLHGFEQRTVSVVTKLSRTPACLIQDDGQAIKYLRSFTREVRVKTPVCVHAQCLAFLSDFENSAIVQ